MKSLSLDVLTEVLLHCQDKIDVIHVSQTCKALYSQMMVQEENSILWKALCKRDMFMLHATHIPDIGYRNMWLQFENSHGKNLCTWFLRYNDSKLCWECNPEMMHILSALSQRQFAVVTALDMNTTGTMAHTVLNTLLGIPTAFEERNSEESGPCLYVWAKPLIQKNTQKGYYGKKRRNSLPEEEDAEPTVKDILFIHASGLFDTSSVYNCNM